MDLNTIHTELEINQYLANYVEESTYLEFKHGNALIMNERGKDEIAKDVSAFANADGGILIYGIEERRHKAFALATFDGNIFTKEWLELVMTSRIRRPIPDVIIDPIRIANDINKSIYVVRIPKSYHAPHYTLDHHFFKRQNFRVREMEEYEIREAYFRMTKTLLQICEPIIIPQVGSTSGKKVIDYRVKISIYVENIGQTIENRYKLEIRLPEHLYRTSVTPNDPFFHAPQRKENEYYVLTFPHKSELYQSEITPMATINAVINKHNINQIDQPPIVIKLYYSSGILIKEIPILELCKHGEHQLTSECFKTN